MCNEPAPSLTAGLNPATAVDYVAYVRVEESGRIVETDAGPIPGPPFVTYVGEWGAQCGTATDKAACQNAVAATAEAVPHTLTCSIPMGTPCQLYVVTTSGDSVQTWVGRTQLRELLGVIDTPQEAVLLIYEQKYDGYDFTCNGLDQGSVREVSDGYEVVATQLVAYCWPFQRDRVLLHVGGDGEVTELRRNVYSVDWGMCV